MFLYILIIGLVAQGLEQPNRKNVYDLCILWVKIPSSPNSIMKFYMRKLIALFLLIFSDYTKKKRNFREG